MVGVRWRKGVIMKRLGAAETSCFILLLLCCSLPQAARLKLKTSSLNRDIFGQWQDIRNIMDKSRLELFLAEYETKETLSVQLEAIWETLKDIHCPSNCSYSQRDIQARLGCECGDRQTVMIADPFDKFDMWNPFVKKYICSSIFYHKFFWQSFRQDKLNFKGNEKKHTKTRDWKFDFACVPSKTWFSVQVRPDHT